MDIASLALAHQRKLAELAPGFQKLFGKPIADFWDVQSRAGLAAGFDIVKFEETIVEPAVGDLDPATHSICDIMVKRFGEDAVKMIDDILAHEMHTIAAV